MNFSGGEKARLALALIAWQKPNLLLLDEPTNHLDLEMRLALTLALQEFSGAVLVVSHDRHLLKSTTDEFLLVADGPRGAVRWRSRRLRPLAGRLSRAQGAAGRDRAGRANRTHRQARPSARQRPRCASSWRRTSARPTSWKRELGGLHEKLAAIEARLGDSALYDVSRKDELRELLSEQSSLKVREGELEERWLEALETLEALQKELEASE
ncbi:ABC transporter ATP-binding protein [Pseudomonas aeruginosa]|nr:ABC transporter ATP-binding protein [Pseudomonas aeruginosa]